MRYLLEQVLTQARHGDTRFAGGRPTPKHPLHEFPTEHLHHRPAALALTITGVQEVLMFT